MKPHLGVEVLCAVGLPEPLSCVLSYPSSDEAPRTVPFDSVAVIPPVDALTITLYHESTVVAGGVVDLRAGEWPMTCWVPVALPRVESDFSARDCEAPQKVQIAVSAGVDASLDSSSLLSTSLVLLEDDADRSQLRSTLEHLQGKLERDRTRHWTKLQELKTKLVERQNAYERDLWKLQSDKNAMERVLKGEVLNSAVELERAKAAIARESATVADLKTQLEASKELGKFATQAKNTAERKLQDLKTAYENSLAESQSFQTELVAKVTARDTQLSALQVDLHTKSEELRRQRVERLGLEEELRRLRATVCKCSRLPEYSALEKQLQDSKDSYQSLAKQFEAFSLEWNSATERMKGVESSQFETERKELLSVIEQLRDQLKETRQALVQANFREEELKAKLLNVTISERVKDDLISELEETNEVNAQLAQENLDLAARLKDVESAFGGGQKDVLELRLRLEETTKESSALREKCTRHEDALSKRESEARSTETRLFEIEEKALEVQASLAKAGEDLKSANLRARELQEKNCELTTAIEQRDTDLRAANSRILDLQQSSSALTHRTEQLASELESANKRITSVQDANARLETTLRAKDSELQSVTADVGSFRSKAAEQEALLARRDAELQSHTKRLGDMQSQILELQSTNGKTTEDLRVARLSEAQVRAKAADLESALGKKDSELKNRVIALQQELADLELILRSKDGDLQTAEIRIAELQDEKADLELAVEHRDSEIETVKARGKEMEEALAGQEAAISRKESELHSANVLNLKLQGRVSDLEAANARLEAELQSLRTRLKETQSTMGKSEEDLLATQRTVEELQDRTTKQATALGKMDAELASAKASLAALSSKSAAQESQLNSQSSELQASKSRCADLQKELSDLSNTLHAKDALLQECQARATQLQDTETKHRLSIESQSKQLTEARRRVQDLDDSVSQKDSTIHQLNLAIAKWQDKSSEQESLISRKESELQAAKSRFAEMAKDAGDRDASAARKEAELQTLRSRLTELQKEVDRAQDHATKLRTELSESAARSQSNSQSSSKLLESLKSSLAAQTKDAAALREELAQTAQALNSAQSEQKQLRKKLEETVKQAEDWKQAAAARLHSANTAKAKADELQRLVSQKEADYAALNMEIETLVEQYTQEREGMESDITQLQEAVKLLEEENNELRQMADTLQSDKEDLDRLLSEAIAKIPQPKSEGKDQIDRLLVEYMQAHNLQNPFIRIAEGLYTFGTKKVSVTVKNGSLIIRVGGGYMFIEEFLRIYLPAETAKAIQSTGESTPTRLKVTLPPSHYAVVRSQSVDVEHKRNITLLCEMKTEEKEEPQAGDQAPRLRTASRTKSYADMGRVVKK